MAESQTPKHIPLRLGMEEDEDINPAPGTIVEARNVRFSSVGGATPRPGTVGIQTTVTNSAATIASNAEKVGALFSIGTSSAMALSGTVFAWDAAALSWEARGNYSTCMPVRKREAMTNLLNSYGQRYGLAVNALGHVCMAASTNSIAAPCVQVSITTAEGIPQLYTPISLPVGPGIRKAAVLAFGNDFLLITQDGVTVAGRTIVLSANGTWTVSAPTTVGTLNANNDFWDVCAESSTVWYIVYQSAAAVSTIAKKTFPAMGTSTSTTFAVTGQPGYTVFSDATNVWVGYNNNPTVTGTVTYRVYGAAALAIVLGATTIAASTTFGPPAIGPSRNGVALTTFCCYSITKVGSPFSLGMGVADLTTTAAGTVYTFWHVFPIAKPRARGRIWCVASSQIQTTGTGTLGWQASRSLLLRFPNPVTVDLPAASTTMTPFCELVSDTYEGILGLALAVSGGLPYINADVLGPSSSFVVLPDVVVSNASASVIRLQVYEYETSLNRAWRDKTECGPTTLIAGQPIELGSKGATQTRFANEVAPSGVTIGFVHPPAIISAVAAVAAGSLTALGTYSWVAVYEWIDPETGRLHQSAPSPSYTTTLTGGQNTVTLIVHGITVDQRCADLLNPPIVVIYRTQAGRGQLQRETNGLTATSAVGETITIASGPPDANLGNFLYTTDGGVEFDLAPSCRFVRRTESAAWFAGLWDRRILQKSRDFFPGEPAEASDLNSWKVYLPEDCEGVAYQDGLTYAFSRKAVYIVTGDGPADNGLGFFDPVRTLTSEFGLVANGAPSILETSIGVFFLSPRGFMLIPRGGGNPVFVGSKVQKSIRETRDGGGTGFFICLGSAAISRQSRTARFLMSDGSAQRVYVFDLDTSAWSYDDYRVHDFDLGTEKALQLGAIGSWPDGCVIAHGRLVESGASVVNCCLREQASFFSDGSGDATVTSSIKFAELRPFGIIGWGRCQTVGFAMSEAYIDLGTPVTATITPDALATSSTARTWSVTSGGDGQTLYREIDCGHMQCTNIQVEWASVRATNATAPGPTLNALLTLTVTEQGRRLLPPSER